MINEKRNYFKELYKNRQDQIRKKAEGLFLNITWEKLIKNDDKFFDYLQQLVNNDNWTEKDIKCVDMMIQDELYLSLEYMFNDHQQWIDYKQKILQEQELSQKQKQEQEKDQDLLNDYQQWIDYKEKLLQNQEQE